MEGVNFFSSAFLDIRVYVCVCAGLTRVSHCTIPDYSEG